MADDLGGIGQIVGAGAVALGAASIWAGGSGSILMAWGGDAYAISGMVRTTGEGFKILGGNL